MMHICCLRSITRWLSCTGLQGEKVTWDVAIFKKVTWGHGLPKSDMG